MELSVLDEAINIVQSKFVVLKTDSTTNTLVLKCQKGHIHKYNANPIVSTNGISHCCITCSVNYRFPLMVHQILEKVFNSPFVVVNGFTSKKTEYKNPLLQIYVVCYGFGGESFVKTTDSKTDIVLYYTTSCKKITNILYNVIAKPTEPTQNLQPCVEKKEYSKFERQPLPYTFDFAKATMQSNDCVIDQSLLQL